MIRFYRGRTLEPSGVTEKGGVYPPYVVNLKKLFG